MSTWQRSPKKSLVVYTNQQHPNVQITRRPGNPVFWVVKDGVSLKGVLTLAEATQAAEQL